MFRDSYDEIILRRASAIGKFISPHTDYSLKTMQVALNSQKDYEGGRLVYFSKGKKIVPEREQGSITIHHNDIVHGVSEMKEGARYGLFFLKKK